MIPTCILTQNQVRALSKKHKTALARDHFRRYTKRWRKRSVRRGVVSEKAPVNSLSCVIEQVRKINKKTCHG
jgi:hypothetical protein